MVKDLEYIYGEKGEPKEEIKRNEKGEVMSVTEFSCDENGNIVKEVRKNANRDFVLGTNIYNLSYKK